MLSASAAGEEFSFQRASTMFLIPLTFLKHMDKDVFADLWTKKNTELRARHEFFTGYMMGLHVDGSCNLRSSVWFDLTGTRRGLHSTQLLEMCTGRW